MIYMITEDYVSFETAKLMKEKGFNEIKCNTCYKWNGNFCNNRRSMSGIDNEICYQAPTLQMAMKWLRKAHKLFIFISPWLMHESNIQYYFEIREIKTHDFETLYDYTSEELNSPEKATEAAIKYCLENLI